MFRSYGDRATDFHARKIPETYSSYICCLVILIDSVPKKDENYYYQQVLSKNTNTLKKKKKQYLDIYTDGLNFSFDYSNESDEK